MALYLLEVSLIDGKESQALYTAPKDGAEPFADETEVKSVIETKLGQAMDDEASAVDFQLEFLVGFDHTGHVFKQEFYAGSHEEVQAVTDENGDPVKDENGNIKTIKVTVPYAITSNRLITVTAKASGEESKMDKYDTAKKAEAMYHKARGSAMKKNSGVQGLLTMITNGSSVGMKEYWVWNPPVVEKKEEKDQTGEENQTQEQTEKPTE